MDKNMTNQTYIPTLTGNPLRAIGSQFHIYYAPFVPSMGYARSEKYLHPMFQRHICEITGHVEVGQHYSGKIVDMMAESMTVRDIEIFPAIGFYNSIDGVTSPIIRSDVAGYMPPPEFFCYFHPFLKLIYDNKLFSPLTTKFKEGFTIGYGGESPLINDKDYISFYNEYAKGGYIQTWGDCSDHGH